MHLLVRENRTLDEQEVAEDLNLPSADLVVLSFTVYATVSKDTDKIEKEKRISEFEYLESELVDIFNELNHIQMSNYNVS